MIIAIGAITSAPAVATADEPPVAYVSIGTDGITFEPVQDFESLVVSVSGGDVTVTRTFDGGAPAVFEVFDEAGNVFPDGSYNYEVTAVAIGAVTREGDGGGAASGTGVQSGSFAIDAGWVVDPDAAETGGVASSDVTVADIIHNDDVIATFSMCIGNDCVNGESFGFDTLRLKENNTRIKFQDTSSTASFPSNDWQITANDSANGGQNKFSIDDITGGRTPFTITAGAPSHSLFVRSNGNVGLNTSIPVVELHIKDGDTPTVRLEQDGSSGFAPQTWDVAGNEANFFVRDVTNGSLLPFRIRPGAPTSSIDIAANGDVGMGTASPVTALHVENASGSAVILVAGDNNARLTYRDLSPNPDVEWRTGTNNNGVEFIINNPTNAGNELTLDDAGNLTVSTCVGCSPPSSRTVKEDFAPVDGRTVLARLDEVPITTWRYKKLEPGTRHIGPMAEDFYATFGLGGDKAISANDLAAVALAAIKAQQAMIQEKDAQISALQDRLSALEEMVAGLAQAREAKSGVTLEQ